MLIAIIIPLLLVNGFVYYLGWRHCHTYWTNWYSRNHYVDK